jgi:hypothetical protein
MNLFGEGVEVKKRNKGGEKYFIFSQIETNLLLIWKQALSSETTGKNRVHYTVYKEKTMVVFF